MPGELAARRTSRVTGGKGDCRLVRPRALGSMAARTAGELAARRMSRVVGGGGRRLVRGEQRRQLPRPPPPRLRPLASTSPLLFLVLGTHGQEGGPVVPVAAAPHASKLQRRGRARVTRRSRLTSSACRFSAGGLLLHGSDLT